MFEVKAFGNEHAADGNQETSMQRGEEDGKEGTGTRFEINSRSKEKKVRRTRYEMQKKFKNEGQSKQRKGHKRLVDLFP